MSSTLLLPNSEKSTPLCRAMTKPLQRHRALSIATSVILFVAFLFFLLIALSIPIIKTIYLLDLTATVRPGQPETNIATEVRFGVWGFCATDAFDPPTPLDNDGLCYGPRLGYSISDQILAMTGYETIAKVALTALTTLLVLHPVVAGLSFIGMISSLWLASRPMHIFSLIITILNTILSTVVFAADLAINIVARNESALITQYSISFGWGNGVWMALVGVIFSWLSMILLSIPVCGCCGLGMRYYNWEAIQARRAEKRKF